MTAAPKKRRISVASYNIHSWCGTDGRHTPERIMEVVDSLNADILALQEVVSPKEQCEPCSMAGIAEAHGYHATFGLTMLREDTRYGNALLSKEEPIDINRHDISVPGREPRGALEVFFRYGERTIKVVCTHLGLRRKERLTQLDTVLSIVAADNADATILMGDFNDWFGFSRERRLLRRIFGPQPTIRTFPSYFPLFSLDKIHVWPEHLQTAVAAVRNPVSRKASDHLPVISTIELP